MVFKGLLKILEPGSNSTSKISKAESRTEIASQQNQKQIDSAAKTTTNINHFSFLSRIKLNIVVNAPIIIVPEHSLSLNSLLLDCGTITIKTSLDIKKNYFEDNKNLILNENLLNHRIHLPPIIEVQKVNLSNMVISK